MSADETTTQSELRRLTRLLAVHERERQLLAFELHDGLVQQMTGALLHGEAAMHAADATTARAELTQSCELLRAALQEARRVMSGLRPLILEEAGLKAAIEQLAHETRQAGVRVDLQVQLAAQPFAPLFEQTVFRIVQEALTNIRRHSRAATAKIDVETDHERLRIVVADSGVGFAVDQVDANQFGLRGIRERADVWGGTALITSQPGQGTTVAVELPIA